MSQRITIEDILDEIDLPDNLTKLTDLQKRQIVNYMTHISPEELQRRWLLLGNLLKQAKSDVKGLTLISNLVYTAKLQRKTLRRQ